MCQPQTIPQGGAFNAASWRDATGNLWLFGGSPGLNFDLWKYDSTSRLWTWINGGSTPYCVGSSAPAGFPAARAGASTWLDSAGNLWLYGGYQTYTVPVGIHCNSQFTDYFNDVWKYDPQSSQWTFIAGPQSGNGNAVTPEQRTNAASWTDASGNLWMFGGFGYPYDDLNNSPAELDELWLFSTASTQWNLVAGTDAADVLGSYGTLGVSAPGDFPGSRSAATTWTDEAGNFWLFGGTGIDGFGNYADLNDLWEYSSGSGAWTWVGGSNKVSASGNYGMRGVAADTNSPGARDSAATWHDSQGNIWLFGGYGVDGFAGTGYLNDLWKYDAASAQWIWVGGSPRSAPGSAPTPR